MPKHSETRALPYSPEQMFDLVADVGRYGEFLPWVSAVRVRSNSDTQMVADLIVGFKGLRESFTSRVEKQRPGHIRVDYLEGPLKHLNNDWKFRRREGRLRGRFLRRFRVQEPGVRDAGGAGVRPRAAEDDQRLRGARGAALCRFSIAPSGAAEPGISNSSAHNAA
jgi:coenzyme Q-binding protein COQ10